MPKYVMLQSVPVSDYSDAPYRIGAIIPEVGEVVEFPLHYGENLTEAGIVRRAEPADTLAMLDEGEIEPVVQAEVEPVEEPAPISPHALEQAEAVLELSVDGIKDWLEDSEPTADTVRMLLELEQGRQDRVGAVRAFRSYLGG